MPRPKKPHPKDCKKICCPSNQPVEAPKVSESGFASRLMAALCKIKGVQVHRQNSGKVLLLDPRTNKPRAIVGAPEGAGDISGILAPEGLRIEIETKTSKGKLRPAQERWAAHIEKAGGIYVYAPMLKDKHVDESVSYYVMVFNDLVEQRRKVVPIKGMRGRPEMFIEPDPPEYAPYHLKCDKVIGRHEASPAIIMKKLEDGDYGHTCINCHDWLDDGVLARKV